MSGLLLYRAATGVLEPFVPALLRGRARRGKEDPARLGERLGRAPLPRPEGPLAWLHGASVGESLSLLPVVEALRAARPGLNLLVTSGTVAAAELLARRLPAGVLHQFAPVDAPGVARRFVAHWRPDLVVFVESELWPNLILEARRHGAALALLSARLSPASLAGWARFPASARRLLESFALVMAQDDATAAGLEKLGARDDGRLNLKLAGDPLPVDPAALERIRAAAAGRPILLAASTHAGEEEIVLDGLLALGSMALYVVVPRHPSRGQAVAALASTRGFTVTREGAGEVFDGEAEVHVADTLGDLGLWLSASSAVLMAGSLIPGIGGHNPLEPARLGVPILCGPHVENWTGVYAALDGAFATVDGAAGIANGFAAVLDDPVASAAMAARARTVGERGEDALEDAAAALVRLLP